ncbi:hypothetical protein B7C42_03121 [Nocardia cerradoensis]|uniref:Uncharacterized protein n=1 Tax=Nocardia cerradoensis TaxID=85688 RepID=A0A231H824_9NOCA|nr:hypothetical protein [Nocardia cerradoensis]OXR45163.1 hypothetical protein B7C42_03121 [Nocardia cerradoensis]
MFSLPMMFAATGWPLYLALHSGLPPLMDYLAIVGMILLIVAANVAIVNLAVGWRSVTGRRAADTGGDTARATGDDPRWSVTSA